MDLSSLRTFVDIAYQCLQKTREQRPTMSVVVAKLKAALELKELHDLKLQREHEQGEICTAAEYEAEMRKAVEELKALLSKGFLVNGGKTLLLINEKGEVCERIYIEACLDPIQYHGLEDSSHFGNSRFPGGHCDCKHEDKLKVRVRAQFLCPLITYSVNLVFKNAERKRCKTLHYKLDGETKCCMVELHDQGLEEYQDIIKDASQFLFYKSPEDLKELLSIGQALTSNWAVCCTMNPPVLPPILPEGVKVPGGT
ncbi:hypothetical protein Tco_0850623 [Tanacetum coccineum]